MGLRGVATINVYADDVAEAANWYAAFLGVEPYFRRSGPDGRLAYAEFRIGDLATELGIVDRRWSPSHPDVPGGVIVHWHVDDLQGTLDDLLARGATVHQPVIPRGEGFVTASVVDPFGNVLGVMSNPHYLEQLHSTAGGVDAGGAGSDTDAREGAA